MILLAEKKREDQRKAEGLAEFDSKWNKGQFYRKEKKNIYLKPLVGK